MLIRFTVTKKIQSTSAPLGVFRAANQLLESDMLNDEQEQRLKKSFDWFNKSLFIPKRFNKCKGQHKENKAISWFKEDAHEYIEKVREIIAVIKEAGLEVREVKTDRPGYILYEDEYQVVAIPFNDTNI